MGPLKEFMGNVLANLATLATPKVIPAVAQSVAIISPLIISTQSIDSNNLKNDTAIQEFVSHHEQRFESITQTDDSGQKSVVRGNNFSESVFEDIREEVIDDNGFVDIVEGVGENRFQIAAKENKVISAAAGLSLAASSRATASKSFFAQNALSKRVFSSGPSGPKGPRSFANNSSPSAATGPNSSSPSSTSNPEGPNNSVDPSSSSPEASPPVIASAPNISSPISEILAGGPSNSTPVTGTTPTVLTVASSPSSSSSSPASSSSSSSSSDPISTAQSTISLSSSTVASGSAITITLTAKDSSGNAISSGGETIVFSHSGGTSTGTVSATTDVGNGTYTATFTGLVVGTATTINATINGNSVTSSLPTATVNAAGAISTAQSVVTVSSATVASASNITLTLTAKDAAGNAISSGGETVAFTHSGGTSTGTISATTDVGNGTYTATFTGLVVGTATTINATINASSVTSSLPTATVNAAGAISTAQSVVTVSSATVASASNITLTLTAKDAAGNAISSGGETVAFTHSGGTSTGTISATTDVGNGTYTATFTGLVVGTATTINATINASSVTSSLPTATVNAAGAISTAQSVVTVSSATVASAGNITLTLTAKDAAGNAISSGGETVAFTHSGGTSTGTISATTDVGNGTYTATFTGLVVGTATTINATINASSVTSSLPTATVNAAGPISTAQSVVTVSSATVASASNITLTLTAKDAAGNAISSGGETVAFTHSGGTSTGTISATTDVGNGTYTATFTGLVVGTATTINATINASSVTSSLPTATVNAAGPISTAQSLITVSSSTVNSGSNITLTLTAKDAAGNAISSGGETIVFSHSGGTSTGTISSTTDVGDGTYTATFTGGTAGTATTINGTINASSVTSSLPTVTVSATSTISGAQSIISVSSSSIGVNQTSTLTLNAKDSGGNNIATGGETIVFSFSGGTATGTISSTTDVGDGTYTATFTGKFAGTATTISATINGSSSTYSPLPTITVTANIITANLLLNVDAAAADGTDPGSTACPGTWTNLANGSANGTLTNFAANCSTAFTGWTGDGTKSDPYALAFDGSDDFVNFGTNFNTSKFTIMAWYKKTGGTYVNTGTGGTSLVPIIGKGSSESETESIDVNYIMGVNSSDQVDTDFENNSNSDNHPFNTTATVSDSRWYHVAVTSDYTASSRKIYINGVLSRSETISDQPANATSSIYTIGAALESDAKVDGVFGGKIAIAQTYSEALTDSQIEQNYWSHKTRFSAAQDVDTIVLARGGTWKYLDDGSDQGTAWTGTGFDDTSWSSGTAELGYGDSDESTVVSYGGSSSNKHETTYFRNTFTVADASAVSGLKLTWLRDDGIVIYINGNEVMRNNMPSGTINYDTLASGAIGGSAEDTFNDTMVDPSDLVTGTNHVAVEIHQSSVSSSDLSFNLELTTTATGSEPGYISQDDSTITLAKSTISSVSTTTVTLQAKDSSAVNLTTGGDNVVFSATGGGSVATVSSTTDNNDGTYTATITGVAAGSSTISATVNGNPVTTGDGSLTVVAAYSTKSTNFASASSQYISMGSTPTYSSGSWSFWVKTTDTSAYLISKMKEGGAFDGEQRISIDSGGKLEIEILEPASTVIESNAAINDGNWHHVVITFNPGIKMYIDSVLQTQTDGSVSTGMEITDRDLEFGRDNAASSSYFEGNLDEVVIYDTQLNQTQINAIYNNGVPVDPAGLSTSGNIVSHWRMGDSDSHPTVNDNSGSTDGTMNNMAAGNFQSDAP